MTEKKEKSVGERLAIVETIVETKLEHVHGQLNNIQSMLLSLLTETKSYVRKDDPSYFNENMLNYKHKDTENNANRGVVIDYAFKFGVLVLCGLIAFGNKLGGLF